MLSAAMLLLLSPIELKEVNCLAYAIYHEARGEPRLGQEAVANVVINRTKYDEYPKTVCKVVYQPSQFSNIEGVRPDKESEQWKVAVEVATFTYLGLIDDPTYGAVYYYNPKKVKQPWWARKKVVTATIANHKFLI